MTQLGPRDGFQCLACFTRPIVQSNAAVSQWPVWSNEVFLSGRFRVSHIMHISGKDYLSQNNTPGPPDMVVNVSCALLPHTAAAPQWPVGSNGCSSVAGSEYHTLCIYQERIICPKITHQGRQIWLSMFHVPYRPIQLLPPQWPVGSNGCSSVAGWESPP